MANVRRREFLKRTILGTTGAFVAAPALTRMSLVHAEEASPLITRTLGKTGMTLPVVSMGVMRSDSPALVRGALKAGIVHLDTAHGYMKGKNEEMLGEVLKDYPRDSFVLSTKIQSDVSKEAFLEKLDLSLDRLKMAHVDILYLHNVSSRDRALDPVMLEALKSAKEGGKARFVGLSTHRNEPEVIQAAIDSGQYEVVLTAINFKQDHHQDVRKAIARAADAGIGIIAMKTMAGAFLDKEKTKPINCTAALKWVLQDENITTAIPGIVNFDQLAENASVNAGLDMSEKEKADLALGTDHGGLYCNGCEHCAASCSKGLPIPDLMRAYMYTYGYGNAVLGRELLAGLDLPANSCGDCGKCSARCVKGFDVKAKIRDIERLRNVPEEFLA